MITVVARAELLPPLSAACVMTEVMMAVDRGTEEADTIDVKNMLEEGGTVVVTSGRVDMAVVTVLAAEVATVLEICCAVD